MANIFNEYSAQNIGDVVVHQVTGALRLADLVKRYGRSDFKGSGRGRRVYLDVPAKLIAQDRGLDETTASVVVSEIQEDREAITLDVHALSVVALSEGQESLDIHTFTKQVLLPEADAVADRAEHAVASVLNGADVDASLTFDPSDPVPTFTAARAALRTKGVDVATSDLVAVVGGNVADALLDSGALDFGKTGTADALRDGAPGRVRGFTVAETGRVDADAMHFFPREALYLALRAPEVPMGASYGSISSHEGFEIRVLADYDSNKTVDRIMTSTFLGAGLMPAYRIERDYDAGTASVSEIEGGALVSVDAAA